MTSEFSALAERLRGEEFTPAALRAFLAAMRPLADFVHYSGQRWKGEQKLTRNGPETVAQRVFVLTHIIKPRLHEFKTYEELGELFGVGKSMIRRHVADFNATFGIYGTSQKRVSVQTNGVYKEAGRRGHETRRKRLLAESADDEQAEADEAEHAGNQNGQHRRRFSRFRHHGKTNDHPDDDH